MAGGGALCESPSPPSPPSRFVVIVCSQPFDALTNHYADRLCALLLLLILPTLRFIFREEIYHRSWARARGREVAGVSGLIYVPGNLRLLIHYFYKTHIEDEDDDKSGFSAKLSGTRPLPPPFLCLAQLLWRISSRNMNLSVVATASQFAALEFISPRRAARLKGSRSLSPI